MRDDQVEVAARRFLERAWAVLESERVLPASPYKIHLRVGHDYFGHLDQAAYDSLEAAICTAYPPFADAVPLGERKFAGPYIFSFLGACIVRLTVSGESTLAFGPIVDECLTELDQALSSDTTEVACLRMVSHLETEDGRPLTVSGVTLYPITGESYTWREQASRIFNDKLFGAGQLINESAPVVYAPPECVVATHVRGTDPYEVAGQLSSRIHRFLLAVRLLHAATCDSIYEVQGEQGAVRFASPRLQLFRGAGAGLGSPIGLIRRVATLTPADDARITGLLRLMDAAEDPQTGMLFTSTAMAFHKFTLSFHAHAWYEQVVDLATALEAALSGAENQDVTLRLRTRAAALLATAEDPAGAIFADIAELYTLRSTVIHGGNMSTKTLEKKFRRLSTVPADAPFGVAVCHMVDRLRDLVRRALLARIALAGGAEPLWPFGSDIGVDAELADDQTRSRWRDRWRSEFARIDAAAAPNAPRRAVESIRPHERSN
jgi:hypothetical protein